MAGEKNAGSIVYEISADVAPLLQAGKQAIESLDGMGEGAGNAANNFSGLDKSADKTGKSIARAADDASNAAKIMERLGNEIAILEEANNNGARSAAALAAQIAASGDASEAQTREIGDLAVKLFDVKQAAIDTAKANSDSAAAFRASESAISSLENELSVLNAEMIEGSRSAAILSAQMKAGNGATDEQKARISELAGKLYDLKSAQSASAKASAEAAKQAAQQANDAARLRAISLSLTQQIAVLNDEQKNGARSAAMLSARLQAGSSATATQRKAIGELAGKLYDLKNAQDQTAKSSNTLKTGLSAIASSIAVSQVIGWGKQFLQVADNISQLQARIARLSTDADAARDTFNSLADISSKTGASLSDTTKLWETLTASLREAGATNSQVLNLTDTLQKIGRIGGSSTEEMANALRQFGQSIASGTIRAEEFNSILEQMPELARQIASGLGVSIGQLRQMMLDGKLSAQDALNAIQDRTAAVNAEFQQLPRSMGQATGALETSMAKLVSAINEATGASSLAVEVVDKLAGYIDFLGDKSTTTADKIWSLAAVIGKLNPGGLATTVVDAVFGDDAPEKADVLKGKISDLTGDLDGVAKATNKAAEATKHFTIASTQSASKTGKTGNKSAAKQADDAATALNRQTQSLARLSTGYAEGSLELAKYDAVLALGNKASTEQIAKAEQQAESIWKIQQATKAAAEEERKRKEAGQNYSQIKSSVSPVASLDNSFQSQMQQLNEYAALYPQKIAEVEATRATIEAQYRQQRIEAMWQEWSQQTLATQAASAAFTALGNNASNVLTGILTGSMSASDALRSIGSTVLNSVINTFVQMGVEWAKSAILGATTQQAAITATTAAQVAGITTQTAASTAAAATTTAAWTPAALMSSIASWGAAVAIGVGAMAGVMALAGKRKNGGPVSAGGMYQVGEGGMPEIYQASTGKQYMIPGDNGKVISNKDMKGAGGINVSIVVENYNGSTIDAQATSDGNGGVTVSMIVADLNAGGPISQAITSNHNVKRTPRGQG